MIETKATFLDATLLPHWSQLTPECLEGDIDTGLDQAKKKIDAIIALEGDEVTFENIILGVAEATLPVFRAWGYAVHLNSVCDSPEIRDAYNKVRPKLTEFAVNLSMNQFLFEKVKHLSQNQESLNLSPLECRLLEETLKDFEDSGVGLPKAKQQRLALIEQKLSSLTNKFCENILDSKKAWEYVTEDVSELDGLPKNSLEAAMQDALEKGYGSQEAPKWRLTLQAPSIDPVYRYAHSDDLRKKVWTAFESVATQESFNNEPLAWKILKLRQEKAELLGYDNFAQYILNRRMAKTPENALGLIESLHAKIKPKFDAELKEVQAFRAKETGGDPNELLEPWQLSYWLECKRQAELNFNEEELRPYFSLEKSFHGFFKIVKKLYGISIQECSTRFIDSKEGVDKAFHSKIKDADKPVVEVWHPDVKAYDLLDEDGTHLGSFYTDWYPRSTKEGGAWMNTFTISQGDDSGKRPPNIGLVVANVVCPTASMPSLLNIKELLYLFHELGHLMHLLLSEVKFPQLAGTSVPCDFVELPSQIMENWCTQREGLDVFAVHYQTGEKLPDALFEKLHRNQTYGQAIPFMRQLAFGKFDFDVHLKYFHHTDESMDDLCIKMLQDYRPNFKTKAPFRPHSFTHVFGSSVGYACAYYSYKWAEVLDADAFKIFKEKGILSREVGQRFRKKILVKGNSNPVDELYKDFTGREIDKDELLRRVGLL